MERSEISDSSSDLSSGEMIFLLLLQLGCDVSASFHVRAPLVQ